jgi:hypothetical protein
VTPTPLYQFSKRSPEAVMNRWVVSEARASITTVDSQSVSPSDWRDRSGSRQPDGSPRLDAGGDECVSERVEEATQSRGTERDEVHEAVNRGTGGPEQVREGTAHGVKTVIGRV